MEDLLEENKKLRQLNAHIKNMVYIPKQMDQVDGTLADYINNFPKKFPEKGRMKIMFLRESEGVYRFG
jgi:hypothetical protein